MNNFGGLGINPTMFAFYQVFAVDPSDPTHLIASDVVNEKIVKVSVAEKCASANAPGRSAADHLGTFRLLRRGLE